MSASINESRPFQERVNIKLLERIQEQIEARPENFDMDTFFGGDGFDYLQGVEPKCGTVACIAGWAIALTDRDAAELFNTDTYWHNWKPSEHFNDPSDPIIEKAQAVLGLTEAEAWKLFFVSNWPREYKRAYTDRYEDNKAAARIAVQVIEDFIHSGGWPKMPIKGCVEGA